MHSSIGGFYHFFRIVIFGMSHYNINKIRSEVTKLPLPMVHLCVAKYFIDHTDMITDIPLFYLGSISPDAVHMRAGMVPADKSRSHLKNAAWEKTRDNAIWTASVIDFYRLNRDQSFVLGYCLHLMTDIYWNSTFYNAYKAKYLNDTSPIQDIRMAYYNDTDQLDLLLYQSISRFTDLWDALGNAPPQSLFDFVSADEVEAWKQRTLHWYDAGESTHQNPIRYLSIEDLNTFIDDCGKYVCDHFMRLNH